MRNFTTLCLLAGICLPPVGCASSEASAAEDTLVIPELPPYDGPKARITVRKFDWKVGGGGGGGQYTYTDSEGKTHTASWSVSTQNQTMAGLEDMLISSLLHSDRFKVVERAQFDSVRSEVGLQEEGWTEAGTGPERGHVHAAELEVYGAVTGWNPDESGSSGGVGGLVDGFLGGIGIKKQKSSCAIDVRIYDLQTSEVLVAKTVRGEASSSGFSAGGLGITSGVALGGVLSEYENTPMEKAIRLCIAEAVKLLAERTPKEYYRH